MSATGGREFSGEGPDEAFCTSARRAGESETETRWRGSGLSRFLPPGKMSGSVRIRVGIFRRPAETPKGENSIGIIRATAPNEMR